MKLRNLISDTWTEPQSSASISIVSPVDGSVLASGNASSTDQAREAVDAAQHAFSTWRYSTLDERTELIRRFAHLVQEHKEELASLIVAEIGKTHADATSEVAAIVGKAETSITAQDTRTPSTSTEVAAGTLGVSYRPLGPTVVLGPFNFPGHLPNGHITPALLAGNSIVFKPSEQGSIVGQRLVEIWQEAGVPPGVINLVHGGVDVGEALIDHANTASVLFTGGVRAGKAIHQRLAGRPEVMLALELGGNNPIIAWNVDDAKAAAATIVRSAFLSSGQRCTCARRLIVEEGPSGDRIVDAVLDITERLRVGSPHQEPPPFMGPLVSERAADNVIAAQKELTSLGAQVLTPAATADLGPAYLRPGVLDVTNVSERPDDEIFGPLLQVVRVKSLADAINEANNTAFGLASGVLTDDDDVWDHAHPRLHAGIVNRNVATVGASGTAPFGGVGLSGNHRPAGFHAADYVAHPVAHIAGPSTSETSPIEEVH